MMRGAAAVVVESDQYVTVGGLLYLVEYTVIADVQYQPAQISGPPENCWPEEGEVDITETMIVTITGPEDAPVTDHDLRMKIVDALDEEKLHEQIWEAYAERDDPRA